MSSMAIVLTVKNTFIQMSFDKDVDNVNTDDEWTIGTNDLKRFVTEPMPSTTKLLEASYPISPSSTVDSLPKHFGQDGDTDSASLTGSDTMTKQTSSESEQNAVQPLTMGYNVDMAASPWCLPAGASDSVAMTPSVWPMAFPTAYPQVYTLANPISNCAQDVPTSWDDVHTVMMRNLPNRVTQQQLLSEMTEAGFDNQYDFVYLPIDPQTLANRGYAFINFRTTHMAWAFRMHYEGQKFCQLQSRKVISVMPATLQGFEANYAHYSSAHVNFREAGARPLFLRKPTSSKSQRRGGQKSLIDKAEERCGGKKSLIDEAADLLHEHNEDKPQIQQRKSRQAAAMLHISTPSLSPTTEIAEAGADSPSDGSKRAAKFCTSCGGCVDSHHIFCCFCGASIQAAVPGQLVAL